MGTNYRPCYVQVVRDLVNGVDTVSYTHLTLPTIA